MQSQENNRDKSAICTRKTNRKATLKPHQYGLRINRLLFSTLIDLCMLSAYTSATITTIQEHQPKLMSRRIYPG